MRAGDEGERFDLVGFYGNVGEAVVSVLISHEAISK